MNFPVVQLAVEHIVQVTSQFIIGERRQIDSAPARQVSLDGRQPFFCPARGQALRRLALPIGGDRPIAAGPSGCAGLQALLRLAGNDTARRAVGLDHHARVLLIGSEGAAGEPTIFSDAVGTNVAAIEAAAAAWDARTLSR